MTTFRLIHNFQSCDAFNEHPLVIYLQSVGIKIWDGDSVRTSGNFKTGQYDNPIVKTIDMPVLYCIEKDTWISLKNIKE